MTTEFRNLKVSGDLGKSSFGGVVERETDQNGFEREGEES